MAGSFSAKVSSWVAESKERMTAVRNMAVEAVVEIAQTPVGAGGNMPVDTGFLRASLFATTSGVLPPSRDGPGDGSFSYDASDVLLTLAGASLDDVVIIGWSASYARYVNYGARGRPGTKFRDLAAQQWSRIVAEASRELEAKVNAKGKA